MDRTRWIDERCSLPLRRALRSRFEHSAAEVGQGVSNGRPRSTRVRDSAAFTCFARRLQPPDCFADVVNYCMQHHRPERQESDDKSDFDANRTPPTTFGLRPSPFARRPSASGLRPPISGFRAPTSGCLASSHDQWWAKDEQEKKKFCCTMLHHGTKKKTTDVQASRRAKNKSQSERLTYRQRGKEQKTKLKNQRGQSPKPKAQGPKPKAQGPRVQGQRGPKGRKGQRAKGPKAQKPKDQSAKEAKAKGPRARTKRTKRAKGKMAKGQDPTQTQKGKGPRSRWRRLLGGEIWDGTVVSLALPRAHSKMNSNWTSITDERKHHRQRIWQRKWTLQSKFRAERVVLKTQHRPFSDIASRSEPYSCFPEHTTTIRMATWRLYMRFVHGGVFKTIWTAFQGPKDDFQRWNSKNEHQPSLQTAKREHFWRPTLRKWWPLCLLSTRFTSMFELFTSRFYLLGVSFHLFRSVSTQSFLLFRRNLRGFSSWTGGKPQVSGVFQGHIRQKRAPKSTLKASQMAFPRPFTTSQSLEIHQWCGKRALNAAQMLLTTSEWPPESWESAGHICTIMTALFSAFGVHCERSDINGAYSGAQASLKERKYSSRMTANAVYRRGLSTRNGCFKLFGNCKRCALLPFPSLRPCFANWTQLELQSWRWMLFRWECHFCMQWPPKVCELSKMMHTCALNVQFGVNQRVKLKTSALSMC